MPEWILRYEGKFVNGDLDGLGKRYDNFGNGKIILCEEGTFRNNKLNGFGKVYYKKEHFSESGESYLAKEGNFVDGELDGIGKTFDKKENIEFIGMFSQGRLKERKLYSFDGRWYEGKFLWDSTKSKFGDYLNYNWRIENGVCKKKEKGSDIVIKKGNFKDSYGMYGNGIRYSNNGKIIEKGFYVDGYLDGEGEKYDGEYISMRGYFKKGQLHGDGVWYFTNSYLQKGKIYKVGTFEDGRLHGYGRRYDKFGEVPIEQGQFINGIFQGK